VGAWVGEWVWVVVVVCFRTVSGDVDKFNDALDKLCSTTGSSSSADGVHIKLESPKLAELKNKLGILKSGKTQMAKVLDQMNDAAVAYDALHEDRKSSINGNPSKCVESLARFLNAVRTSIVHFEARR